MKRILCIFTLPSFLFILSPLCYAGNITFSGSGSSGGGGGSGTVTSVGSGTGLTGGPITTSGSLFIANTGISAGTYGSATQVSSVTFNAQGQATSASNVSISISTTNLNATGTASNTTFLRGDNTWATPAGGSGSSSLAVGTGTVSNFTNIISSPTPALSFTGTQFNVALFGSTVSVSIANTTVAAGSYGSATQVPNYTVGADGRLTAAANTTISLTNSNLQSGTYSNVTIPLGTNTTGIYVSSLTAGSGISITGTNNVASAVPIISAQNVSSFTASGVTAGSYTNTNLTVNAQGIITVASNGSAGGGGGSAIAMGTGTASNFTNITTASVAGINLDGTQFHTTLLNGGTVYATIYAIPDSALTSNVDLLNSTQTFSASKTFTSSITTNVQISNISSDTITNVSGSSATFNLAQTNWHFLQMSTNTPNGLLISNPSVNQQFTIILKQPGAGSTLVNWFSGISWPGGIVPTLTTNGGKSDTFTFKTLATGLYFGYIVGQNQ